MYIYIYVETRTSGKLLGVDFPCQFRVVRTMYEGSYIYIYDGFLCIYIYAQSTIISYKHINSESREITAEGLNNRRHRAVSTPRRKSFHDLRATSTAISEAFKRAVVENQKQTVGNP